MNRSIVIALVLFLSACQGPGHSRSEADSNANTAATESGDEDWIRLFDGSNMDHWRGYRADEMPEGWSIEDGAMVITEPTHGGDLVTRDSSFQNFELKLEWKVPKEGNSGIMFHVTEDYGSPWETGPEMQICDSAFVKQCAPEELSAGSNYAVHAPSADMTKPAGEWNSIRLIVNGSHVEHWMNGSKVVEYELWTNEWRELVNGSKWVNHKDYGMRDRGHIALQGDHSPVAFRNISLRRLPDTDPQAKASSASP